MAKDQKAELLLDAADSPFTADPLLHAPIDSVRGAKAKAERLSSTGTLAGPARLLRCPELREQSELIQTRSEIKRKKTAAAIFQLP